MYKITINERNYSSWKVFDAITEAAVANLSCNVEHSNFSPLDNKLFNNDVFSINSGVFTLDYSSIRISNSIPGVLILQDNKTYGRNKTSKSEKLLYKCIPDNTTLPAFLVPYEFKTIGFSKVFQNLYVTFRFSSWEDKHPYGTLDQVIGPVNEPVNFYEYQLYCKNLNYSILKFTKKTIDILKKTTEPEIIDIVYNRNKIFFQDRTGTEWNVFSIDPEGSVDFDDAFSIKKVDDNTILLSIYIANVPLILDALNIWHLLSKRTSTIYLPDKKRPMLPLILSDYLCSLQMGCNRIAFVMDLTIQNGAINDIKFSNAIVKLSKNYVYEILDNCADYPLLKDIAINLNDKYKYMETIVDSHDVVAYLMILMNYECSKKLIEFGNGIFRSLSFKKTAAEFGLPDALPSEVNRFLTLWTSSNGGKYIDLQKVTNGKEFLSHDVMGLDSYIHITSPIRRIVDLLNMIKLQSNLGIQLSAEATDFYSSWVANIDFINVSMRSIRKTQNVCSLLNICYKNYYSNVTYRGYVFDCQYNNDGIFKYNVYLPDLKMVYKIKLREKLDDYSRHTFSLFIFNDEANFKQKVRLQICG